MEQVQSTQKNQNSRFALLIISTVLAVLCVSLGFLLALALDANRALKIESPFSAHAQGAVGSPSDALTPQNIEVYEDKVVIRLAGASLSSYAPTGSMEPLLNEHANGLRIVPHSTADIHVGDIISFERGSELIVHRVVEKGSDDDGVYFITQGDNALVKDGKVRFSQIKYKTVAILY